MTAFGGDFSIGPYEATYKGNSIGLLEGEIRVQQNVIGLPIRASLYGQTIINYVLQGAGHFVAFTIKEWNANSKAAMWQFGTTPGIVNEAGLLFDAMAGAMVLTALSGTPAATEGPVTRTYPLAVLLPGHNLDTPLGPVERNIQIVFAALPEPESSGSKKAKFFTDT